MQHLPRLDLSFDDARRLQLGQHIQKQETDPEAAIVRAYEPDGRFMGIVTSRDSGWQPHKMFLAES